MSLFWLHRDLLDAMEVERGFSLFSAPHLIWLALMGILIISYAVFYRRAEEQTRDNMRKILALFLILFEIFKQCLMVLTGVRPIDNLPLDICSYAEYAILIDALWPGNGLMKQLMAFAFLPAAFMALLLPTVTVYPPVNFFTMHQFVMHAAIVAYIVARYAAGELRPRYKGLWITLLVFAVLSIPVYHVNAAFGSNYMFLKDPYGNPVLEFLWELSGGNGGNLYGLALMILSALVFHIMYAIFGVLDRCKSKH